MNGKILRVLFLLLIFLIAGMLQAVLEKKKKTERRRAAKKGATVMRLHAGAGYLLAVVGLVLLGVVAFFAMVCYTTDPSPWEEVKGMVLVCLGLALFIALTGIWLCLWLYYKKIIFDGQGVALGALFHSTRKIPWESMGRMEKQDHLCQIFDREGRILFRVPGTMSDYGLFCETAEKMISPGNGQAGPRREW